MPAPVGRRLPNFDTRHSTGPQGAARRVDARNSLALMPKSTPERVAEMCLPAEATVMGQIRNAVAVERVVQHGLSAMGGVAVSKWTIGGPAESTQASGRSVAVVEKYGQMRRWNKELGRRSKRFRRRLHYFESRALARLQRFDSTSRIVTRLRSARHPERNAWRVMTAARYRKERP